MLSNPKILLRSVWPIERYIHKNPQYFNEKDRIYCSVKHKKPVNISTLSKMSFILLAKFRRSKSRFIYWWPCLDSCSLELNCEFSWHDFANFLHFHEFDYYENLGLDRKYTLTDFSFLHFWFWEEKRFADFFVVPCEY